MPTAKKETIVTKDLDQYLLSSEKIERFLEELDLRTQLQVKYIERQKINIAIEALETKIARLSTKRAMADGLDGPAIVKL